MEKICKIEPNFYANEDKYNKILTPLSEPFHRNLQTFNYYKCYLRNLFVSKRPFKCIIYLCINLLM